MQLKWNYTFSQTCVATDLKPADSTKHRLKVFEKMTAAVQLPSLSDVAQRQFACHWHCISHYKQCIGILKYMRECMEVMRNHSAMYLK